MEKTKQVPFWILANLGCNAAETVSYVPQHLATNHQPTLNKIPQQSRSHLYHGRSLKSHVPICRMSCMDRGSLASCSCRISDASLYCNTNTHYTARNCAKCSLTAGRVHTTATIYIIFTFPNEKGVVLGKSKSCRLTTNLPSLPAFCRCNQPVCQTAQHKQQIFLQLISSASTWTIQSRRRCMQ